MERKQLMDKIVLIIAEQMGHSQEKVKEAVIRKQDHLERDFGADSLDIVELAMEFEDDFDINISDDEAESALTVDDIITLIQGKLAERGE